MYVNSATITFAAYPASPGATYQCQLEVYRNTGSWSVQNVFAACTSPKVLTMCLNVSQTLQMQYSRPWSTLYSENVCCAVCTCVNIAPLSVIVIFVIARILVILVHHESFTRLLSCNIHYIDPTQNLPVRLAECISDQRSVLHNALQTYTGLQAGNYRFSAKLTGQASNAAAQSLFNVDTVGPEATITEGPDKVNNGNLVSFVFTAEGAATFECSWVLVSASIDAASFETCTSPV